MKESPSTPYANLLPPLSTDEFEALKADIKENGVRIPIFVDETGAVLDGHTRLKVAPDAPRKVIRGLTEAEKAAFVFQCNFVRRNLSPDQKREALRKMKEVAFSLRQEDPKKNTQARVGRLLGVTQNTVSRWFGGHNIRSDIVSKPDARVKLSKEAKEEAVRRDLRGDPTDAVAADYGVSERTIKRAVQSAQKSLERQQKRRAAAASAPVSDDRIIVGDFRKHADRVADGSVSLIFTDPPYDREAAKLLPELGAFAASKLATGGSLLCYVGHLQLPAALDAFREHLRYWWTIACVHSGGTTVMREYGVRVGWKPVLWFVKKTRDYVTKMVLDTMSGGEEKSGHDWQQAESEAAYWIEKLCPPDGLVVDPFLGSGTTGAAATKLNRDWIGFEVDPDTAAIARKRVSE